MHSNRCRQGIRVHFGQFESGVADGLKLRHDHGSQFVSNHFQDEIAFPLGLDFYIRLPEWIPNDRLATPAKPRPAAMLLTFPIRLTVATLNHRSNIYRALAVNPGSEIVHDEHTMPAGVVGYQVISKVPALLHSPLMAATNAISGISLVGS